MQETRVRSLDQEDPLEKEMATPSSILAWDNSIYKGDWQATVHGVAKSQTQISDSHSLTLCSVFISFQGILSIWLSLSNVEAGKGFGENSFTDDEDIQRPREESSSISWKTQAGEKDF